MPGSQPDSKWQLFGRRTGGGLGQSLMMKDGQGMEQGPRHFSFLLILFLLSTTVWLFCMPGKCVLRCCKIIHHHLLWLACIQAHALSSAHICKVVTWYKFQEFFAPISILCLGHIFNVRTTPSTEVANIMWFVWAWNSCWWPQLAKWWLRGVYLNLWEGPSCC